jgi:hypothetical protein
MFFVIGLISGIIAIVGAFFLAPDKRTPTERFNDKLSEYNMSVDNMVYIDEGKVFKFDNEYYLRTSNGDIVSLSTHDASIAYEKYTEHSYKCTSVLLTLEPIYICRYNLYAMRCFQLY